MWKLLKALPKTWRHKVCTPLGSNPACPDEQPLEQNDTANDGIPDTFSCKAAAVNEPTSQLKNDHQELESCGRNSYIEIVVEPKSWIHIWPYHGRRFETCKTDSKRYAERCPFETVFRNVISLLLKRYGRDPDNKPHEVKETLRLRVYKSITRLALTANSFDGVFSVLPNPVGSLSKPPACDTLGDSKTNLKNEDSKPALTTPTCHTHRKSDNDELLSQLEDIAAEYTSHILNSDAKQLVKHNKLKKAMELFKAASDLGLPEAKYNLGVCYESGIGLAPDMNKALRYFNEAASHGHNGAYYNLAVFHLEGKGIPVNEEKGIGYMEKASEGGIKEAHTFLGIHCGQHGEYKKAVQYFRKAVDQKDPDGQYYLGLCYEHGVGVETNLNKALDLYKKASVAGNADACYILGTYYEEGLRGVAKDKNHALGLYQKAASEGHQLAVERLKWISVDEDDEYVFFEDNIAPSQITTKEPTLRITKSSPELTRQNESNSKYVTTSSSSSPKFDFSLVNKFIEQWNSKGLMPSKTFYSNADDDDVNAFREHTSLSQSLTTLSSIETTPPLIIWDNNPPKSNLVTMQ